MQIYSGYCFRVSGPFVRSFVATTASTLAKKRRMPPSLMDAYCARAASVFPDRQNLKEGSEYFASDPSPRCEIFSKTDLTCIATPAALPYKPRNCIIRFHVIINAHRVDG